MSAKMSTIPQDLVRDLSQSKRQRRAGSIHSTKAQNKQRCEDLDFMATKSTPEITTKVPGTLFDAVAGRLDDQGFIIDGSRRPVAPDEALFRRKNAPVRYQEDDKYFAHRHLPTHVRLADSDLLKAIHAYVSDFYASASLEGTEKDYQSMDETALLAMGILLEETCRHSLGNTGDLAFVDEEKVTHTG